LKRSVIARFQNQRARELSEAKSENLLKLRAELETKIEKAKKAKDKKSEANLKAELRSLSEDSVPLDDSNIVSLETIQCRAKELHDQLATKEEEFMGEDKLEDSMLCEVNKLNLLNFLKVFEVKIELVEDSLREEKEQNPQLVSELRSEVSRLSEMISGLESELILKVKNLLRRQICLLSLSLSLCLCLFMCLSSR
jgi:hypothetical protein